MSHSYQAHSWLKPQRCYSKIESTVKGLNVRHIISNMEPDDAREIYFEFYVKRGEASENRIKDKNKSTVKPNTIHNFGTYFRL